MSETPLALVGATGVLGRQVLNALQLREHDAGVLRLFATERSAGEELDYDGEALEVEKVGADAFRGVKAAILAVPPSAARPLAAQAQAAGVWVVDASGAHRLDAAVPLVAPGVNDAVLARPFQGRIVSVAQAAVQGLTAALSPLQKELGLAFADATVLMGAATKGHAGVERLSKQTAELLNGREPDVEVFPHRLAFNVIPGDPPFEKGLSAAERALLVEAARIWEGPLLPALTATALYVPTYHGLTLVLSAHLKRAVTTEGLRDVLKASRELKVLDDPEAGVYPMPMLTNDDATVHVGRLRVSHEHVQLVAALDNAFRVADTAVGLALALAARG